MWGTEYVEPHPGNIREMSRSVTVTGPNSRQTLQIETKSGQQGDTSHIPYSHSYS